MAEVNSIGNVPELSGSRREVERLRLRLEQADFVVDQAAHTAEAIANLASRGIEDLQEDPDQLGALLVAIRATAQHLGAACDSHGGYSRSDAREWYLPPAYLDRDKQLGNMGVRRHG